MSKPIDLIVANHMHDVVSGAIQKIALLQSLGVDDKRITLENAVKQGADYIARDLLCSIAMSADIRKIYAALKAVGAPDSAAMIREGIQAVRDRW